jgi:ribonuclease III
LSTSDPTGSIDWTVETELERRISYVFDDRELLVRALSHRSYANERGSEVQDNEVLEFLGDSVLGLVVSDLLCTRYPTLSEGEMSKLKSFLVSADTLARLADDLGLGEFMLLGRGEEKTAGREKNSILANAFEALIAALYVDGGLEQAAGFVLARVVPLIREDQVDEQPVRDFKSALQEMVQAEGMPLPTYAVVAEDGPDHDKVFHIEAQVGERAARGQGRTKKRAEQRAARLVLETLLGTDAEIDQAPVDETGTSA